MHTLSSQTSAPILGKPEGKLEYGRRVIETLSNHLQRKYGTNEYSPRSLRRMMQFAQAFPDLQMVTPVVTQLSCIMLLLLLHQFTIQFTNQFT
ncbi:MAG: DUF1016 family protein [Clostridia bacterium]|nr:DUF1016 family protein [Clostridia bacterium]NCC61248.1 DUF1016 family protein [Verrucomicrobiae bacterium]